MNGHEAAIAAAMIEMGELYGDRIDAEVATWPDLTDSQKADIALIVHGGGEHAT